MSDSGVDAIVGGNSGGGASGGGGGGGGGSGGTSSCGAGGFSEDNSEYQSLEHSCYYETGHPEFYPLHEPKYHPPVQQTPKNMCLGKFLKEIFAILQDFFGICTKVYKPKHLRNLHVLAEGMMDTCPHIFTSIAVKQWVLRLRELSTMWQQAACFSHTVAGNHMTAPFSGGG